MFDGIPPLADPPPGLAECDLRGMKYFQPLRSVVQDFDDLPRDTRDMMERLYDAACRNTPGASLSSNIRVLARLADTTQAAIKRRFAVITEKLDLTKCTDGRLYVGVAVTPVTTLWERWLALSARGSRGAAKRWRKTYSSPPSSARATPQAPSLETRKTQQNQQNLDANLNYNSDHEDSHTPAWSESPPVDPVCVCENDDSGEGVREPLDRDPLQPELVLVAPTDEPAPAPKPLRAAEPMPPPVTTPAAPVTPAGQPLAPPPARPAAPETHAMHELPEPAEPEPPPNGQSGHNPRREPSRADFDALVAAWPNRQAIEAAWPLYRAALLAEPDLTPDRIASGAAGHVASVRAKTNGNEAATARYSGQLRYWLRDKRWLDVPELLDVDIDPPSEADWRSVMGVWTDPALGQPTRERWYADIWGPMPGDPGCRVPAHLASVDYWLAEFAERERYRAAEAEREARQRTAQQQPGPRMAQPLTFPQVDEAEAEFQAFKAAKIAAWFPEARP